MRPPGKLAGPLLSPDVLVYSQDTLPKATVAGIKALKGVSASETISLAQFFVAEQGVTYAAVDPGTFRRFTPVGTAQTQEVWDRVARGEMAVRADLGKKLEQRDGYMSLGNGEDAPKIHIGAYGEVIPRVDAVVNEKWAAKLHMREGNAMVVSTGNTSPQSIRKKLGKLAGARASVQILGPDVDPHAAQTAILTGGSVARAVGSFNYTANRDGSVNPDPRWVAGNIRTEQVPILGAVRCHKVMLPQLRAALTDIVRNHLADRIHPGEYGGCFHPRYIAGTSTLSFHTFGTAIDLNVPGNQRGTTGQMDPAVVSIFKRWGFAWGGDWGYTDPMHFELSRLVKVG